jgi:hypothetical protein
LVPAFDGSDDFDGIRIVTLSEGDINELHIGLKGTMDALYALPQGPCRQEARRPARPSRERQVGRGNAYGYDVVRKMDANGEPIGGDRVINEVPRSSDAASWTSRPESYLRRSHTS